ncbi:MAG TPA: PEPxxWA-CTERM sorting domain-containing protein [Sphingomonas sp.]|uniref:PEPxxWA-CTERM sorting domain-containing protein n=1 Tax=Sphingomonas sp. TaxID=28214 RepID=UPI002BD578C0|nr:PEPxxWA-CTERM sorting domain-containing protein [Sphingomonas sp.]HMI18154.1 PEPxxWA-CTERM sorting domain-containing protein [Sphingomonas sp.]
MGLLGRLGGITVIQYKHVLKPTILFAAGSFATAAQATHFELDYTATDGGTAIALGVPIEDAQFTFTSSMGDFGNGPKSLTTLAANGDAGILGEGGSPYTPDSSSPYQASVKPLGPFGVGDGYYGIHFTIGDETEYGYFTVDGGGTHVSAVDYGAAVVAPPPAVPEPAIWAEMILGFGMAGAALRRRQSALSATA